MVDFLKHLKKSNYVMIFILLIIFAFNVMFTYTTKYDITKIKNKDKDNFSGSASCVNCHKSIYESHIKTAHYLDSRTATKEFIKGSFEEGKNKFIYNKWMEVILEQKKDSFYQTAYINAVEYESKPFDIVIGSGRKGQTYLYWADHSLFQLPVSYYTPLNSWCNSPGFSSKSIKFNRIIEPQCLECHSTYAATGEDENKQAIYDKSQIIYGIDCERCHGPAANHVAYYSEHPTEKSAKFIITTKQLNRLQKLDGCALCHSGFRDALQPAFTFKVGDKLDDFSKARYKSDSVSNLDVHGNQYGLLTDSKCFKMSQMDCSSCHNVHVNEANNPVIFSQKCITCHTISNHSSLNLSSDKKDILNSNCIDCHMPMLTSHKIVLNVANTDKAVPDMIRTHRIGIYPAQTKVFLEKMKL